MVDAWRRRDGCGLEWVVAQAVGSGVTLEHSGRDAITVTHHNGDLLQPGILLWISNVACINVSLLYRVIKGEGDSIPDLQKDGRSCGRWEICPGRHYGQGSSRWLIVPRRFVERQTQPK